MQEDELDLHDGDGDDRDEVPDSYEDGNKDIGQAGPYLIFVIFLHRHNFWKIKLTPKNANFSR